MFTIDATRRDAPGSGTDMLLEFKAAQDTV
jgi:hypothetical protein